MTQAPAHSDLAVLRAQARERVDASRPVSPAAHPMANIGEELAGLLRNRSEQRDLAATVAQRVGAAAGAAAAWMGAPGPWDDWAGVGEPWLHPVGEGAMAGASVAPGPARSSVRCCCGSTVLSHPISGPR